MSDRTTGERPPGSPSQRALGAMENAVRRARERTGAATTSGGTDKDTQPVSLALHPDDPPSPPRPSTLPTPPWDAPPGRPTGERHESARREHWLSMAVVVVATLVVVGGIALAVSAGGSGGGPQGAAPPVTPPTTATHTGATPAAHHPKHQATHQPTHQPTTNGHSGGASGSSTTTSTTTPAATSTAPPASPGGPPVIALLSPASGAAGQGIQVDGSNFLSSDGQIVATFNGQVAPTSCPAANTCTVTVPPMSGSPAAQVVITTASGASNAVTFTYS